MRFPILLTLTLALLPGAALADTASGAKVQLIPFSSSESAARFDHSKAKVDFFKLANQFEGQITKGHCGVASSVIVLNTLRIKDPKAKKPRDASPVPPAMLKRIPPKFDPIFDRYTQRIFFDPETEAIKTQAEFFGQPKKGGKPDPGFQIRQLHRILQAKGLKSTLRIVDDKLRDAQIKKELVQNLSTAGDYVIINYFRPALGQPGGGHISPLGAYDEGSDSFLILDVNPTAQEWVWVPSKALISAMRTFDTVENRGYLLLKDG